MIISKNLLIVLVFVLSVTLLISGLVQMRYVADIRKDTRLISESVVVCGDLDARLIRLEETH